MKNTLFLLAALLITLSWNPLLAGSVPSVEATEGREFAQRPNPQVMDLDVRAMERQEVSETIVSVPKGAKSPRESTLSRKVIRKNLFSGLKKLRKARERNPNIFGLLSLIAVGLTLLLFILSILLYFLVLYFGVVPILIATSIVLGVIGLTRDENPTMAIIGMISGILIALSIIGLILFLFAFFIF
ncbi:MAG: hypothetical protein H6581_22760 [Bacteroidia bacterium]|nr:hypothetical protein [Bacteroidia bacterium]